MNISLELLLSSIACILVSLATIVAYSLKIKKWLFQDIYAKLDKLESLCKRNELITLFKNYPENVQAIEEAYDDYERIKGNGYIKALHQEWLRKYAREILAKSI